MVKDRHYPEKSEPRTIDLVEGEFSRPPAEETVSDAGDAIKPENAVELAADTDAEPATPDSGETDAAELVETDSDEEVTETPTDATDADGIDDRVEAEPVSASAEPPVTAAQVPAARKGGGLGMVAAGVIGSLVTMAGAGGAWYAGLVPTAAPSAQNGVQVESLVAEIALLKAQAEANKTAIESAKADRPQADSAALDGLTKEISAISAAVKGLDADMAVLRSSSGNPADAAAAAALGDRLKGIEDKIAALPATGTAAVDPAAIATVVDEKIAGVSSAVAEVKTLAETAAAQAAEAAAGVKAAAEAQGQMQAKLEALGTEVSTVSGKVAENSGNGDVARTIAAAALKSAIDRGSPFMAELETFAAITGDSEAIASLRGMAASGVPTRAALSEMIPDAAYAMIAAGEQVPADAGLLDRLASSARSLVKVRAVGEVEGEGVQAITARLEAAIKRGDYAKAMAEYETLPAEAKAAGAEFMGKVKARMDADGLIETVLSDALKSAAKQG